MKSNALRIGNYVGRDGNVLIVEKIDVQNNIGFGLFEESKGQHGNSGNKYFIDLNEEWLLRFGFEKIGYDSEETGYGTDYHLKCNNNVFMCYSDDFSLGLFASEESKKDDLGVLPSWENTKTVHGLQNLYFALTGEELKIK